MQEHQTQDLTLAGLVHDLKNVLETIGEAAEALLDDPQWSGLAATIERAVDQGRRITTSFQESVRTFELDRILENAVQSTRDFILASKLPELRFIRSIEPGIRLAGQPGCWERVFVNLFLNSARVMRKGGEIEVLARRTGDRVEIHVSDTGPGIPQEILGQVFHRGFSTNRAHTGLGLSIVESIVQNHGGSVIAGNRVSGTGATISISVPDSQIAVPSQLYAGAGESTADFRIDERA